MSVEPTPKRRRPLWHWIAGGIGVLIVLSVLANMGDDDADDPITSAPGGNAPAATAAPTDAPLAPAFADIEAKRVDSTDIQWDTFTASLKGNRVDAWPGIVREVKAKGDEVEVSVDLTPGGGLMGVSDAFIRTSDPAAAGFGKDQAVIASGTIDNVDSILGSITVRFEDDATVTAAP